MAVYTLINKSQLESILAYYNLGELIDYTPISSGTTNSNYLIKLTSGNGEIYYIFTILEQNLKKEEIEFCINYMLNLKYNNINIAFPISDRTNLYYRKFFDKYFLITKYISGQSFQPTNNSLLISHCETIGENLAYMHLSSFNWRDAKLRTNPEGLTWCNHTIYKLEEHLDYRVIAEIHQELEYIDINYNKLLDCSKDYIKHITGPVHTDLFCDNVIFDKDNKPNIIDFFYACTDFYLYDLSIVINDWVFDFELNNTNSLEKPEFNQDKYNILVSTYIKNLCVNNTSNKSKNLGFYIKKSITDYSKHNENQDLLNLMLRFSALKFWLMRLNALYIGQESDNKTVKNPKEYEQKLLWHKKNKLNILNFF